MYTLLVQPPKPRLSWAGHRKGKTGGVVGRVASKAAGGAASGKISGKKSKRGKRGDTKTVSIIA